MIPRLVLLAALFGSAPLPAAGEYRFSMDGREFDPHILPVLGERKGAYAPGDVSGPSSFPFVLGKPGHYQFRIGGKEKTKRFCKIDDQPERCVGVILKRDGDRDDAPLINPLAKMTPAERGHLWGIVLRELPAPKEWEAAFEGVDWSKTVLSIDLNGARGKATRIPPLPTNLRYLELFDVPEKMVAAGWKDLTELRYLRLYSPDRFDLRLLENASQLRNLDIEYGSLANPDALANLGALRFLKIRRTKGLGNLTFVRSMPHLRVLKIDHSEVTDLRPVAACPDLRLFSASATEADQLPDPAKLPALRDLRLLGTPVALDKDRISAFRKAAPPDCIVRADWQQTLLSKLGRIDRLRVRTGDMFENQKTHFEIADPDRIGALMKGIKLNDADSGLSCNCNGDPRLEFYREEQLVITISFQHSKRLRWRNGLWPGDALLTPESADLLCDFMAGEGLEGPKKNLEEHRNDEAPEDGRAHYQRALENFREDASR